VQDLKKTTESKSISNNLLKLDSHYLGLMNYEAALQKQFKYHQLAVSENKATVLGLEHPAVLTLGYRADTGHNIGAHDIPAVKIERGGLATIHSEGQLVIYPILSLKKLDIGVRDYVTILINSTKQLLQENGIESTCSTDSVAGLFTKTGKIAFCGIQVKNGASLHGLSLNVSNDLKLFDGIISCGVSGQKMDSMKNHGSHPALEVLFNRWIEIFNYNMLNRQEHLPRC